VSQRTLALKALQLATANFTQIDDVITIAYWSSKPTTSALQRTCRIHLRRDARYVTLSLTDVFFKDRTESHEIIRRSMTKIVHRSTRFITALHSKQAERAMT
jgi:hypothetical protein